MLTATPLCSRAAHFGDEQVPVLWAILVGRLTSSMAATRRRPRAAS